MDKKTKMLNMRTTVILESEGEMDQKFMHSFSWEIFIEHLIYLRHYCGHCKYNSEQREGPVCMEFTSGGDRKCTSEGENAMEEKQGRGVR